MLRIFIGYDPREAIAYHVCADSIIRTATEPVSITPLALNMLAQLYRETHTDGSNQFIYSRFLVPFLCGFNGTAIYLDGDMVVNEDIGQLTAYLGMHHAVAVVKHDYKTSAAVKYLGHRNDDYPRKNWSSVIVWNCGSYLNRKLTPDYIAGAPGSHLHRFAWLDDARIGDIPLRWNWLDGEYNKSVDAALIHYTLGTPCFNDYADSDHAPAWHRALIHAMEASGEHPEAIVKRAFLERKPAAKPATRKLAE